MHKISCSLLLMTCLCASSALAQNAYKQANPTSDLSGVAVHTDSQLVNPWGSAFFPGNPFWVADNNGGVSTLYDASGKKQSLVVPIATASVKPCSRACPTGIV